MFTPKRADGRSEARVVYDHAVNLQPGDTITHDEIMVMLNTNDKQVVYRAAAGATKRLWKNNHRSLGVVTGVGYRVLRADEHEVQAGNYKDAGHRKIKKAVSVMKATDLSALTPTQRNWVVRITTGMVALARTVDHHASKIAEHEDLIKELQDRVDALEK